MGNESINPELELAAKRTLSHITGSQATLKPLYLQPDRAVYLAENLHIILKVYLAGNALQHEYEIAQKAASIGVPTPQILGYNAGEPSVLALRQIIGRSLSSRYPFAAKEAGKCLQRFHALNARPPFSGGQQRWDAFISWWENDEMEKIKRLAVFDPQQMKKLREQFELLQPPLAQRPVVLLHGDLQPSHILIDPQSEQVLAFLDFVDAQPGDPLLDIAILTLWDHQLTSFLLEGYSGIEHNEETRRILSFYRLLRLLAEIPWLLERGFKELAERNISALSRFIPLR